MLTIIILQEEIAKWCDEATEGTVYMYLAHNCAREDYHCMPTVYVTEFPAETSAETHYTMYM